MFTVTLEGLERMIQTAQYLPLPFQIMMLQHYFLSHSLKGVSAYGSEQSKKRTVNSSLGAMSENN